MRKSRDKMVGNFQRIARAMSKNWNVTVVPSGVKCSTNGQRISFPFNADYLEGASQKVLHGILDHEVAHVAEERRHEELLGVSPIKVLNSQATKKERMLVNVFEDVRIECRYSEMYKGVSENIHEANVHTVELIKRQAAKGRANGDFWKVIGGAIIAASRGYDISWVPNGFAPFINAIQDEIAESVRTEWVSDSVDLAHRVIEKIGDAANELEEESRSRQENDEDGEENDETDGDDEGDETDGDDEGEGDETDGDDEGEGDETDGDDEGEVKQNEKGSDDVPRDGGNHIGDMGELDLEEALKAAENSDMDAEDEDLLDKLKRKIDEEALRDVANNERYIPNPNVLEKDRWVKPETGNPKHSKLYNADKNRVNSQIRGLKGKLLGVIRGKAAVTIERGKRRGKLDRRALHRVPTGAKDVFKTTIEGEALNTAVMVVLDLSGSMGSGASANSKARYAKLTGIALGETFAALNVPFAMVGFHNDWSSPVEPTYGTRRNTPIEYVVFKDFDEKFSRCKYRLNYVNGSGNNTDGEAVLSNAKLLYARPEERKILIVASDGMPRCDNVSADILEKHLYDVVGMITSAGMETLGIGIQTDAVKQFYNESNGASNIVIRDLEKLAVEVYRAMRAMLLKKKLKEVA